MFNLQMSVSQKLQSKINGVYCFAYFLFVIFSIASHSLTLYAEPFSEVATTEARAINAEFGAFSFQQGQIWLNNPINRFRLSNLVENYKTSPLGKKLTPNDPNQTPHWLAGSYYNVRDELTATLMLNNKGVLPLEVTPTLYNSAGQKLELPPVTVEATSARFINLSEWAAIGGESYKEGNIRLFYRGKDLVLGAQIYLINEQVGLSFEEKLLELGKFDSRRLEGLWTMPSNQATVKVALTNTTDDPITVNARLTRRPNIVSAPQVVALAPHETRLLDLRQDFADGQQAANSSAVALSLDHSGTNWALLARTFIADPVRGYSNLAQFANPLAGKTKEYHGAGLQLRTDTGERLKPVVVVKNTAGTNAVVTGKVPYTRADGTTGVVTLPTTTLGSNEIRLLNLSAVEQRNNSENIKAAGIEIRYNTAEGSVVVGTHTESANKRQVFRVPMWDPLRQKTATGGYPWRIEGTSTTKAYIKNITDRPQKYTAFFNWENGGMYIVGLKELAAHQIVEIDVKDLRDRQVPDENGNTIPLYLSRGQFQWSLRPEEGEISETDPLSILALLGRSDQIDYAKEISNNYACENCCVNNPTGSRISPNSADIRIGETKTLRAQVAEETCTGIPFEYYEDVSNATWTTSNSSVASVSGGNVTGHSAGSATIRASFSRSFRVAEPCPPGGPYLTGCLENQFDTTAENKENENNAVLEPPCGSCRYAGTYFANPQATVTVVGQPHIEQISPTGSSAGGNFIVRFVGSNFGNSPTVNVSGNGITTQFYGLMPDGFEATFQIAENADMGDRNVTVTVQGQTSNSVTYRVGDRTPTIASISQTQASAGQSVSVTINGTDFGLNPLVSIDGLGVNPTINSSSTTQIQAIFTVATGTYSGSRNVKVVSRGRNGTGFTPAPGTSDTSNAVGFQVFVPQPSISDIDYVEKNGLRNVTVSVTGAQNSDTTKFRLRRLSGSGSATFENGTTEVSYTGNVSPQTLKIKGVTESSDANNYTLEALVNNSTKSQPHKEFTIATISSLVFERINTTGTDPDIPLDNNPGTDGTHTAGEGLRIFPDKNSPADNTDRATLRVRATVAPASVPNLRVYLASFDLDDPSANAAPIDPNASDGKDNNGNVNNSKSGEFSNPTGGNCTNASTGTSPNYISKIECSITNNTASANFKVTRQPGDNFAIAASLMDAYRNEIRVNSSAGADLINNANQVIPVSGEANPNNVQGIRTQMLTVWRKLHIEIDSMSDVTNNNETGTFSTPQTINTGTATVTVAPSNPLATNRFENGRLVIQVGMMMYSLRVVDHTPTVTANTASTITVDNPGSPITVSNTDSFIVYDDDDFDGDDAATLNGDDGDDVTNPNMDSLTDGSDNPANNVFAEAYVRIAHETTRDIRDDAIFRLNTVSENATDLRPIFTPGQDLPTSANVDPLFWSVYVIGSYQCTLDTDNDPNEGESAIRGIVDEITLVTGDLEGSGALIFKEVIRATEIDDPSAYNIERNIVAHEVGHLFSGEHSPDGGLMGAPISSHRFSTITLNKIRRIQHP